MTNKMYLSKGQRKRTRTGEAASTVTALTSDDERQLYRSSSSSVARDEQAAESTTLRSVAGSAAFSAGTHFRASANISDAESHCTLPGLEKGQ